MVDSIWHLLYIKLTHLTIKETAYSATQCVVLIIVQEGQQLQLQTVETLLLLTFTTE